MGAMNVPAEVDTKTLNILGEMIQTAWTESSSAAEAKLPEAEKKKKGPPFTLMLDMRNIPDSHPTRSDFGNNRHTTDRLSGRDIPSISTDQTEAY